ncbi:NUDIX domain-containing protein [Candidatus Woesearchaeota archaeon]|nr:NUDIX domain-containing protein [Candidatus Woesearchaeota archaeon]
MIINKKDYEKILEVMPICCVDLIISYKGEILFVKRKNKPLKGKWCFPGGRIYKNEKLEKAATRKAFEEVGINIKIERKLGVYETFFRKGPFQNPKTNPHTINIVFIAKPASKNFEIKIDKQSSEYKWFDEIKKEFPNYVKEVLDDYKKLISPKNL